MKTIVLALLDKNHPPEHSFVDGMLADSLAKSPGLRVRLCVSRSMASADVVARHISAVCLAVFYPRKGFKRIRNFGRALCLIKYQIQRERRRGNQIILFVRNDPIYLLAASLLRPRVDRLIFQSSFPHEQYSGHPLNRVMAKLLYRIASARVDAILAVSPLGLERVRKLMPSATLEAVIPLLSDLIFPVAPREGEAGNDERRIVRFAYIGSHAPARKLEVVLEGVVKAIAMGARARFHFVGGSDSEIKSLASVSGVAPLVHSGIVRFLPRKPRVEIPELLSRMDVGLSLIPPEPIYQEASPTKLAEYMGAGLVSMATRGVPLQEKFVVESESGVLVDWSPDSIARAIVELSSNYERIREMKEKARHYAIENLTYAGYVEELLRLIHGDVDDAI